MRILAHRGSPGTTRLENTVPAIRTALTVGADGVEVDLRLTADGVLIACHDADLGRITGDPLPVVTTPWRRLRECAARAGTPLARLEDVVAATAGHRLVLELKPAPVDTADALADQLTRSDVTVSSFDPLLLSAFRAQRRTPVRTALLGRRGCLPLAVLRQALQAGHDEMHPHIEDLLDHPATVATAARHGIAVVPWTVNTGGALRRCAELDVDAVITDVPLRAARARQLRPVAA